MQSAPQEVVPPGPQPLRRPWGFWATMGWSGLCLLVAVLAGSFLVVVLVVAAKVMSPSLDVPQYAMSLSQSGVGLALGEIVATLATLPLVALFVWIRRWPIREYLGLTGLHGRQTLISIGILAVFLAVTDVVTYALGRPVVPEFMVDTYKTAGSVPLLVLGIVVAAPLFEETLFRGFMFRGIAASVLGPGVAVVLTSALWSLLHFQYDGYGILVIFLTGIFLGVVRLKTGSTTLPILLHGLGNLAATVEVMIAVDVLK